MRRGEFINAEVTELTNLDRVYSTDSTTRKNELPRTASVLKPKYQIHFSFWLMQVSFFLLFLAFNCVQNLASTLIGDAALIAICILYFFFIISNLLAPVILSLFSNNAGKMMFYGSLSYTAFVLAFFLASVGAEWTLYLTAVFIGSSGGPIWVGNNVFIMSLSSYSTELFLDDPTPLRIPSNARGESGPDTTQTANVLTQAFSEPYNPGSPGAEGGAAAGSVAVAGAPVSPQPHAAAGEVRLEVADESGDRSEVTSMVALVRGSAVSFMMSIQWATMNINTLVGAVIAYLVLSSDGDANEVDADPTQVKILFLVFTGVAVIANVFYLLTATRSIAQPPSKAEDPWPLVRRTLRYTRVLLGEPRVYLCIGQYMAAAMGINFVFSSFTGTAVKYTLGAANVSLVIMCTAGMDVVAALVASRFTSTLRSARYTAITGGMLQLLFMVILAAVPYTGWSEGTATTKQWVIALGLGALGGAGDGMQAVALNSSIAHLVGESQHVRAAGFSILQSFKGLGSVVVFLLPAVSPYEFQLYFTMSIISLGLIGQFLALKHPGQLSVPE
jgi:MFS family permease